MRSLEAAQSAAAATSGTSAQCKEHNCGTQALIKQFCNIHGVDPGRQCCTHLIAASKENHQERTVRCVLVSIEAAQRIVQAD